MLLRSKKPRIHTRISLVMLVLCTQLSGCAVLMVADAATGIAVGAVKATVGVAGAVVDVVIPSTDND